MARKNAAALERVDAWLRGAWWRSDVPFALLLAVVLLPSSLQVARAGGLGTGWAVVIPAAVALQLLAVAFRRRAPVTVFVTCALAELVLALAPHLRDLQSDAVYPAVLLPSSLVYLVAAYSVSSAGQAPWPALSLVVGGVGSLVVVLRAASGTTLARGVADVLLLTGLLLASVVAAWALGRFRRLRAEQLVALAERAARAERDRDLRQREAAATERARIARELHDVIAHSVSVMVRQAEGGRYVAARDPGAAAAVLGTIADTGREALTDIRSMLGVLDSDPDRPAEGPQPTVADLPDLVDRLRAAGQPVRLRVDGEPQPLDAAAHLAAYRLVQEALTNVVKHAGGHVGAEVALTWTPEALQVSVTDDGAPRPATAALPRSGRGLVGMGERLRLVGGTLTAGPGDRGGFVAAGEIPTTAARRAEGGA
ncbi:MAG: sensor histidine kinase [Dermatophilaceae bacterium]